MNSPVKRHMFLPTAVDRGFRFFKVPPRIPFGRHFERKVGEEFLKVIEGEIAETFLEVLLSFMKLKFMLDAAYRKNIENFKGRYQFKDRDREITVLVKFDSGRMDFEETTAADVNITCTFKNGRSFINFLLSKDRDILRGLLNNEIVLTGNLNYMYKFGFMANHLLLELTGNLP
jgi:hypothetical protein